MERRRGLLGTGSTGSRQVEQFRGSLCSTFDTEGSMMINLSYCHFFVLLSEIIKSWSLVNSQVDELWDSQLARNKSSASKKGANKTKKILIWYFGWLENLQIERNIQIVGEGVIWSDIIRRYVLKSLRKWWNRMLLWSFICLFLEHFLFLDR